MAEAAQKVSEAAAEAPEQEAEVKAEDSTTVVPDKVDWEGLLTDDSDEGFPEFREVTEAPVADTSAETEEVEDEAPDASAEEQAEDATPQDAAEKADTREAAKPDEAEVEEIVAEEKPQKVWTEEELASAQKKYKEKLLERYLMSEAQGDSLLEAPHKMLPKMLADFHAGIVQEVWSMMQNFVPQRLEQDMRQRETRRRYEDQFFNKWPKLKAHRTTVQRLANAYRQANPGATVEQAIQEIGAQAHIALKIPVDEVPEKQEQRSKPFTPERAGGGATPPPPARELNPFEQMAEEFLDEDY